MVEPHSPPCPLQGKPEEGLFYLRFSTEPYSLQFFSPYDEKRFKVPPQRNVNPLLFVLIIIIAVFLVVGLYKTGQNSVTGRGIWGFFFGDAEVTENPLPSSQTQAFPSPHKACLDKWKWVLDDVCNRYGDSTKALAKFNSPVDLCNGEDFIGGPNGFMQAYFAKDYPKAVNALRKEMDYLRVVDENGQRALEFALSAHLRASVRVFRVEKGTEPGPDPMAPIIINEPIIPFEDADDCAKATINPLIIVMDRTSTLTPYGTSTTSMGQHLIEEYYSTIQILTTGYVPSLFCYDEREAKLAQISPVKFIQNPDGSTSNSYFHPLEGALRAYSNKYQELNPFTCSCMEMSLNDWSCGDPLCPEEGSGTGLGYNDPAGTYEGSAISNSDPPDPIRVVSPTGGAIGDGFGDGFQLPEDVGISDDISGGTDVGNTDDPCGGGSPPGGESAGSGGGGNGQMGECSLMPISMPSYTSQASKIMECAGRENPRPDMKGGFGLVNPIIIPDFGCEVSVTSESAYDCSSSGFAGSDIETACNNKRESSVYADKAMDSPMAGGGDWVELMCTVGGEMPCTQELINFVYNEATDSLFGSLLMDDLLIDSGLSSIFGDHPSLDIIFDTSLAYKGGKELDEAAIRMARMQMLCLLGMGCNDPNGFAAAEGMKETCAGGNSEDKDRCGYNTAAYCSGDSNDDKEVCVTFRQGCQANPGGAGCDQTNKDCEKTPDQQGCSAKPPPGSSTPEGPEDCSAENDRFKRLYQCIYGETISPPDPGNIDPCPSYVPGCDFHEEFQCLGGDWYGSSAGGGATDCEDDKQLCPDGRCMYDCSGNYGSGAQGSMGIGWYKDCGPDKEMCPDGTCQANCNEGGIGIADVTDGSGGDIEPPIGPEPDPEGP